MSYSAIVIGGTGATGKQLIKLLLRNEKFTSVTSIGRRPVLDGAKNDKLIDIVVDSMVDLSSTQECWDKNDVFFNCIGTTRQKAGGAKEFIDIELGISREAARMASLSNIPHAALISASGANHKTWAVEWLHPLLYTRTMGQKEQTIISEFHFETVSVFKPGMLIRLMEDKEWYDDIIEKLGVGLRVDVLARAMMKDVENIRSSGKNSEIYFHIGNSAIIELAQ